MKEIITTIIGAVGGVIAFLFGGWSTSLIVLLVCMGVDYLTGLIVAGIFHKSKKSSSGNLESRAGWKGLFKKISTLLLVIIGHFLDMHMGTGFIRDAICIAFISNELLSIIENAGLMGIPIPKALSKALAVFDGQEEKLIEAKAEEKETTKDEEVK